MGEGCIGEGIARESDVEGVGMLWAVEDDPPVACGAVIARADAGRETGLSIASGEPE